MLGIAPALSCARSSTTPSTERDNGLLTQHALEQVAEGGASAVSLNAIAKAMGMSGPAIYRYFASRDELLASLVTAGYDELTAALEEAERAAVRRTPARRLAAVIAAYRAWALAHPQHYAMLFGIRPAGSTDSTEAIVAVHGGMLVLLRLLGELSEGQPPAARPDRLVDELVQWSARRDDDGSSPLALRLGVLTWTRLHGIVSLELAEVFASMGVAAELLVEAEPQEIIDAATE